MCSHKFSHLYYHMHRSYQLPTTNSRMYRLSNQLKQHHQPVITQRQQIKRKPHYSPDGHGLEYLSFITPVVTLIRNDDLQHLHYDTMKRNSFKSRDLMNS